MKTMSRTLNEINKEIKREKKEEKGSLEGIDRDKWTKRLTLSAVYYEKLIEKIIELEKALDVELNREDLEITRELLSEVACGYERKNYHFHCCDANEVIKKIDNQLVEGEVADE